MRCVVEVNIETDFAARDEQLCRVRAARSRRRVREAYERSSRALLAGGLDAERETLVQSIGENVSVRRIALLEAPTVARSRVTCTPTTARRRSSRSIGGDDELLRDIAMHVTASNRSSSTGADVSPEIVAEGARDLHRAGAGQRQAGRHRREDGGRPRAQVPRRDESARSAVRQRSRTTRVGQLLSQKKAHVAPASFGIEVGEGIDKVETDFAAEVAAQVRGKG